MLLSFLQASANFKHYKKIVLDNFFQYIIAFMEKHFHTTYPIILQAHSASA